MPRVSRAYRRRTPRPRRAPYAIRDTRTGDYHLEVWGAFYSPAWVSREDAGRWSNKRDALRAARTLGSVEVVDLSTGKVVTA